MVIPIHFKYISYNTINLEREKLVVLLFFVLFLKTTDSIFLTITIVTFLL